MATNLDVKVKSLIGAKPFLNYNPAENPSVRYPDGSDRSLRHELLDGSLRITSRRIRRAIELELDPINETDQQAISEIQETQQDVCISPPWTEDAITFLGLQGGLTDMREPLTRGTVNYSRACKKANSVTGEWSSFDEPVYENCDPGKGIHLTDPALYEDHISYELKTYLTADAENDGNTTLLTIPVADAVRIDAYDAANDNIYKIAQEGQTADTKELFEIDSINTTTGVLTVSTATGGAASAALGGTADYLIGKKTYITAVNFVADAEMEEDGLGVWSEFGTPELVEKTRTQNETGTRALRFIGGSANDGVKQVIGSVPAGTDMVIRMRIKILGAPPNLVVRNTTDASDELVLVPSLTVGEFGWAQYSFEVARGGAGQKEIELRIYQGGATRNESIIDRVYIFKDQVDNGGMEGTYAGGVAPGWAAAGADETPTESADKHGGAKAQQIADSDAIGDRVTQVVSLVSGDYYRFGGFLKRDGGSGSVSANFGSQLGSVTLTSVSATYELKDFILIASGAAANISLYNSNADTTGLFDDIFVIKLIGNPTDQATHLLPRDLDPDTGHVIGVVFTTDIDSDEYGDDERIIEISRPTWDADNRLLIFMDAADQLSCEAIAGGTTQVTHHTASFSTGDQIIVVFVVNANGSLDTYLSINGGTMNAQEDATTLSMTRGLSKMWIGKNGNADTGFLQGSVSSIIIENTPWTSTQAQAFVDRYNDDTWLKHIRQVDGIQHRIRRLDVTPYPAQPDLGFGILQLEERFRNAGAFIATQD